MTHNEVAEASGISIACWYRLYKEPDRLTIQQLISLANGLHIPAHLFFSLDDTDVIGVREDYIKKVNYQKCYYDSNAVRKRIGEGTENSWRKTAKAIGMHWTNVSSSLLAVSRTPVVRLLTFCEKFGFNLFEFLIDPNTESRETQRQEHEGTDMHQEIAALNEKIDNLNAMVDNLTSKYEALLMRVERFEADRDCSIGMAAEEN